MRQDERFGDIRALRAALLLRAKSITRCTAAAEDLVQSLFVAMWAKPASVPAAAELLPWAFVVMRNIWINDRRRSGRTAFLDDMDLPPLTSPDNPETQTYCRQVMRIALGLEPSLLFDAGKGHRWEPSPVRKSAAERVRRHRARQHLVGVAA